jgi:hypothetical protein
MTTIWPVFQRALMITSFVAVMMILVEYLNVLTEGRWRAALRGSRWTQYLVAALLGAVPGCLGAFVIVALLIHRSVSLGAVVACMIATSGDEAFVMLAMFPGTALLLTLGLAAVGVAAGAVTDVLVDSPVRERGCDSLDLHPGEPTCDCFDASTFAPQLLQPSAARGVLVVGCGLFVLALVAGTVGPPQWDWIRFSLLGAALFALFVVATVPEHFIEEHLWRHVVLQHVPRILLWTLGAMSAIAVLQHLVEAEPLIRESPWLMLGAAGLLGLIPESGPHLLIVTLYDAGTVPFSVLFASSIVQDGHGMLPLLAHSWRQFLEIKLINLVAGLIAGGLLLMVGA